VVRSGDIHCKRAPGEPTTGMVFAPQTLSFSEIQALARIRVAGIDGLVKRKAKDVMGYAWPGYITT
jgi:hypothetical protein